MLSHQRRIDFPAAGRAELSADVAAWIKANGRTDDVRVYEDLYVVVDNDPKLCTTLRAYFADRASWISGFQDYSSDYLSRRKLDAELDCILQEPPDPAD